MNPDPRSIVGPGDMLLVKVLILTLVAAVVAILTFWKDIAIVLFIIRLAFYGMLLEFVQTLKRGCERVLSWWLVKTAWRFCVQSLQQIYFWVMFVVCCTVGLLMVNGQDAFEKINRRKPRRQKWKTG